MAKTKLPSVLAYEKKLVPSNGIMFASKWEERGKNDVPLKIIAKSIKGTISIDYLKRMLEIQLNFQK